jgi:hypothetical protein
MTLGTGGYRKSRGLDFGQFPSGLTDGRFSAACARLFEAVSIETERLRGHFGKSEL